MRSPICTVLIFLIQINQIKTVSKTKLSLIHFDRIREGRNSTSEKLEDIYDSDSRSCASQMSSQLPNVLTASCK
jgi:maleate cis-trans isomerase